MKTALIYLAITLSSVETFADLEGIYQISGTIHNPERKECVIELGIRVSEQVFQSEEFECGGIKFPKLEAFIDRKANGGPSAKLKENSNSSKINGELTADSFQYRREESKISESDVEVIRNSPTMPQIYAKITKTAVQMKTTGPASGSLTYELDNIKFQGNIKAKSETPCEPRFVVKAGVRVRENQNSDSKVLKTLRYGSRVCVMYKNGEWTKIKDPIFGYAVDDGSFAQNFVPGEARKKAIELRSTEWAERALEEQESAENVNLMVDLLQESHNGDKAIAFKKSRGLKITFDDYSRVTTEAMLLPLFSSDFQTFFDNDAGHVYKHDVPKTKNPFCAVSCADKKCKFVPIKFSQIFDGGKVKKISEDTLFYLAARGLSCQGSLTPVYVNDKFVPLFSNDNPNYTYISATEGEKPALADQLKKLPVQGKFGELNFEVKKNGEKLQFTVMANKQTQVLETWASNSGVTIEVIWVGDLSRDGKPDFIYRIMSNYGDGINGHFMLMHSKMEGPFERWAKFEYYNGG